ncbi:oxidoreductase Tas%2C aldo/keto reductase family [Vibrio cholerae]|nr:oxidoreductase Tas%2C aldo/keto reductase family [Vibrio cholerae]
MEQLKSNLDSLDISLNAELLQKIQEIGTTYSNPCP